MRQFVISNLEDLNMFVNNNNVIFEGFSLIGKAELINSLSSFCSNHLLIDKKASQILPESIRWAYLIAAMDLSDNINKKLLINRSIISACYFNEFRHPEIKQLISLDTFDMFRRLVRKGNFKVILLKRNNFKDGVIKSQMSNPDKIVEGYNEFNSWVIRVCEFMDIDVHVYFMNQETK